MAPEISTAETDARWSDALRLCSAMTAMALGQARAGADPHAILGNQVVLPNGRILRFSLLPVGSEG